MVKAYRWLFVLGMVLSLSHVFAQQYLKGSITDSRGSWDINYDRTQAAITKTLFRTTYKVLSVDKRLIYTIAVTHNRAKKELVFTVKGAGVSIPDFMVNYADSITGLILSDRGNLDTTYNVADNYKYLVSFTSAKRDYPILHKLKLNDGEYITLDPITFLRLRKHNELIAPILLLMQPTLPVFSHSEFIKLLMGERSILYFMDSVYSDSLVTILNSLQHDSSLLFKNLRGNKLHYVGNKLNNKPEGKGILIDKGNIYEGHFANGQFDSGMVVINAGIYIYYGGYYNGNYYGLGAINYSGNRMQGVYANGVQTMGMSWANNGKDELYFGGFANGSRNGYGELRNATGVYCGMFTNGKLTVGYAREKDTFGYTTYSYIDGDSKTTTNEVKVMDFMDAISPKK